MLKNMTSGETDLAKLLFFYDYVDELVNGYTTGRVDEDDISAIDNYSLEQLWLMYVMKELHNKKWNGEAWV